MLLAFDVCSSNNEGQPLKRGIKGAMINQQRVIGLLLDRERDAMTVLRPENQSSED